MLVLVLVMVVVHGTLLACRLEMIMVLRRFAVGCMTMDMAMIMLEMVLLIMTVMGMVMV